MNRIILFCILLAGCFFETSAQYADHVLPGATQTMRYLPLLKNKRVALMVNQTATIDKTHLVDTLLKLHVKIQKIFSPEHGFRGTAGHGEKVANSIDSATGIPIISLYGQHRKATADDLKDVDILLFDVQDVGARFFTYISSLQELMESAAENKKTLVILDRPNPNGDYVDGPVLDTAYHSFIGMQPIPVVHGMTVGEYASMLNGERWLSKGLHCNIKIIPCENYSHQTYYRLPIKPSPNLPNMAAVNLYPSLCLFEGTTLSLGRGTDKPFQLYGTPYFPKQNFTFTPRASASNPTPVLKDQLCYGFDLSNAPETIPHKNRKIELKWLINAYHLYTDKEKFFTPFFTKLAGNTQLQQQIIKGMSEADIRKSWEPGLAKFKVIRAKYLLY
ncbi:exo-beta-N-acetylmuramidase NamZ domain-containing protein [Chitinophaga sp. 30R24]|uniref:exo-beta-N-acetylmuramidase NamZ family protein n=1 Tax=Chitinophaga sp. 30R24 TaxID=3248838 RepID=UPI003B8F6551